MHLIYFDLLLLYSLLPFYINRYGKSSQNTSEKWTFLSSSLFSFLTKNSISSINRKVNDIFKMCSSLAFNNNDGSLTYISIFMHHDNIWNENLCCDINFMSKASVTILTTRKCFTFVYAFWGYSNTRKFPKIIFKMFSTSGPCRRHKIHYKNNNKTLVLLKTIHTKETTIYSLSFCIKCKWMREGERVR